MPTLRNTASAAPTSRAARSGDRARPRLRRDRQARSRDPRPGRTRGRDPATRRNAPPPPPRGPCPAAPKPRLSCVAAAAITQAGLGLELDRLGGQRGGLLEAALPQRDVGQVRDRDVEQRHVAGAPAQACDLFVARRRGRMVAAIVCDKAKPEERLGPHSGVVGVLGDLQQLLGIGVGSIEVAQPQAEERALEQRPDAGRVPRGAPRAPRRAPPRLRGGGRARARTSRASRRGGAPGRCGRPRAPTRWPSGGCRARARAGRAARWGGPGAPSAASAPRTRRSTPPRTRQSTPHGDCLTASRSGSPAKSLRRVLADRLEHREARLAVLAGLAPEQAVVTSTEPVDGASIAQTAATASSVQPPANTARRRSSACSGAGQQVMAPVDRRPQRACRSSRSRAPSASSSKRWSSRRRSARGGSTAVAAAASSIASGSRSSRGTDRGRGALVGHGRRSTSVPAAGGARGEERGGVGGPAAAAPRTRARPTGGAAAGW